MKIVNKDGLSQQYKLYPNRFRLLETQSGHIINLWMEMYDTAAVVTGRMLMLKDGTYFLLSPNIKHFLMH